MLQRMRLTVPRNFEALALAVCLTGGVPGSGAAQEIEVIRSSDVRPEHRIDVNGSVLTTIHVENAESVARVRMDWGMVSPKAWAIRRLITNSNFVGCSTGRSAGLAPLRSLST